jgi:hypothetical protein
MREELIREDDEMLVSINGNSIDLRLRTRFEGNPLD